jgi:hypothetical protein
VVVERLILLFVQYLYERAGSLRTFDSDFQKKLSSWADLIRWNLLTAWTTAKT